MPEEILAFETTAEVKIPKDPFAQIIGQEHVVKIAKLIPYQRRHLLLVGPPGTGKSMIAHAIASVLSKPKFEISVVDNFEVPERPLIEVRNENQIKEDKLERNKIGIEVMPVDLPTFVAERFGYRCRRCGDLSENTEIICPGCGAAKTTRNNLFEREYDHFEKMRAVTTRRYLNGIEETIIYEKTSEGRIILLNQEDLKKLEEKNKKARRKVLVPIQRSTFLQATGSTETELLGDIRHDPYGGHPHLGTPAYLRVVPGAVHEAHEGVLFIDELSTLGAIQRYILTSMQNKKATIIGRNPLSSGAAVRVEEAPCNFIFVGACNINDLKHIIPPLRSRIRGDGYEVLMNSHMPNTQENKIKVIQFIAQEILKDGKIPHASAEAAECILEEAQKITKKIDNENGLTLRLRNLSGIIKMAGDIAVIEKKQRIEKEDVLLAIHEGRSVEEKLREKYGTWWATEAADHGLVGQRTGAETA